MKRSPEALATGALLSLLVLLTAGCGKNLFQKAAHPFSLGCCGLVVVVLDIIALLEIAGSNRSVGDKIIWALFIVFAPVLGFIAYYFFARK